MSNDLEAIEHLMKKIRQLPPHLIMEVDKFVTFLLQKYQSVDTPKETGFWTALQQFRQQTDLSEFSEDVFVDIRDKSIGREVMK